MKLKLGKVRVFDEPGWCRDSKQQAAKVLEEAAEVFGAWQARDNASKLIGSHSGADHETNPVSDILKGFDTDLADECADVIQTIVNLSAACDIDLKAALDRCEERNRERGRIS